MGDTDKLRPEVKEAWRRMRYASELTKGTVLSSVTDMEVIFRDHMRLAGVEAERDAWREKYDLAIAEWANDLRDHMAPIEAELAALKARINK